MTQDDLPKSEPRAPETPDASAPTAHHGLIVALGIKQVLTPTSASNTLLIPQDVNISEIEGCAIRLRRNTILLEHDYCVWLTFQGVCAIFYATGKKSCMLNIGGHQFPQTWKKTRRVLSPIHGHVQQMLRKREKKHLSTLESNLKKKMKSARTNRKHTMKRTEHTSHATNAKTLDTMPMN
nr:hypothetical protein [Tanacetum cinerariifolium]